MITECKYLIKELRNQGKTFEQIAFEMYVSTPTVCRILEDPKFSPRLSTLEKIKAFNNKYAEQQQRKDKVTDFELDETIDKAKEVDPFKKKTDDERFWGLLPQLAKLVPEGIELILRVKKP